MIDTVKDSRKVVERALLVGIIDDGVTPIEAEEHIQELAELVKNLSVGIIDRVMVKLKHANIQYMTGSGKAEEICAKAQELKCDCIVFDCDLSPSQQRNWEKLSKIAVLDRQEIIIEIFASRASTREAVLQVQLARMKYFLPRLTRAWTHFSKQYGGSTGGKGEGEKQIELDRRSVKFKISQLEKELIEVRKHRGTQRKSRERNGLPHAAIVGYTNAGKSSLLNALASAEALVQNKLFATLDPLTRKAELPDNREILLTDTVGFVRKLPHSLVEAFKATLEEANLADFLIIVLDISSPHVEDHWWTTLSVLKELDADEKKKIVVFNKIDCMNESPVFANIRNICPDAVSVSALTGEGLDELKKTLNRAISSKHEILKIVLPPERHDLAAFAHEKCKILESEYAEDGTLNMIVNINSVHRKKFEAYIKK